MFILKRSNQKLLAALILSIAAIFPMTASASNEVTVGAGTSSEDMASGTNDGSITAEEEFDWIKHEVGDDNLNRCFYGMAALVQDTGTNAQTGYLEAADYAYLVNNGSIVLHYKDIVAAYADQLDTYDDATKKYDNIMGWGMLAGNYSTLINNGTIELYYDQEDSSSTYGLFSHPMYVYDNSSMINNGTVRVTGTGSTGSQVRGLTTQHSGNIITNNGLIYIDVDKSYMSRALATTGDGGIVTNNGTIYNSSSGPVYGMSSPSTSPMINNGIMNLYSTGHQAEHQIGIQLQFIPGAYGFVMTNWTSDGTITNNGVVRATVTGDSTSHAETITTGMMLMNQLANSTVVTMENTGVIDLTSNIEASADNQYSPRTSEIAINAFNPNYSNTHAKIGNWATTLRDFSTTKDFVQARNGYVDFSTTNLILRPESGYTAGTSYLISADTLVAPIAADTNSDANVVISGIDSMTYSTEMSDFISANVVNNGDSTYNVSLIPVNNESLNKKMISTTAMFPIDFTRGVMDQIDREIERRDRKERKWFIAPYYSRFDRSDGMDGHAHGYLAGADWRVGSKAIGGIQAAYSLGSGDGDIYSANGNLKNVAGGVHVTLYPQKDKSWIRAQATAFHTSGDTNLTMTTDTSTLNGKVSNASSGVYVSTNAGIRSKFTDKDFLRSEIGLSYLNFSHGMQVDWSLLDYQFDGYQMKMDKYHALYANLKETYVHNFSDNDSLAFGLGVRGRLSAEKLNLNMMNTDFSGSVREDPCQGLVDLSYIHQIKDFAIDLGYQGIFGSDLKNNLFHASLKLSF